MIERKLFKNLKDHLNHKEISLIIGPRQAGKTTLMLLLKNKLDKKRERTLFLNLDIEADKRFFSSQETLIKKIELELGKKKGFVFIDEIQRKEDAGIFLKGIYDMNLPYKYIVSGSGSVELKRKIHESLVGRKRIFELNTLSFEEFFNFKTQYRYKTSLLDFFNLEVDKTRLFLDEYLLFGGYPRVVLNLVRIIAAQTGRLINFSELSSLLGISAQTVKDYLWYLEKTFILHRVTPYFHNVRKEIRKSPLFYFFDLGLRNYSVGSFGNLTMSEIGFVFQNFVFNVVRDKLINSPARVHFWKTTDGAEVDFVIDLRRGLIPIEVKLAALKKATIPRSLRSFISQYNPPKSYIINTALKEIVKIEKTKVYFIPFFELMSLDFTH